MKLNNVTKSIFRLALMFFILLMLGQSVIYGASGTLYAGLDKIRWLPIYNNGTNSYTYNSTEWGFKLFNIHPVYQILELDSTGIDSSVVGENGRIYCLNATQGVGWNTGISAKVEYDSYLNLKDKQGIYQEYSNNKIYDISNYEYYSSIVWLLDNFYIPNVTNKDDFFANIGIYKNEQ